MLKNINRRFFLKKTIYSFTSFIFLSNFLVLFLKKKNNIKLDNLTDNYFFALEKYRIETVNEIFSLYLKNGISGKRIIHNISKRRTMNNYFHKINTKYLWNNRMNINI